MIHGSKSMFAHFNQKYWTQKYLLYSFELEFTHFTLKLLETRFFRRFDTRPTLYSFNESHSSTSEYECQKRDTRERVLGRVSTCWPH